MTQRFVSQLQSISLIKLDAVYTSQLHADDLSNEYVYGRLELMAIRIVVVAP